MADHFSGRFLPGKALPLRVGGRLEACLRLVHPPQKEPELPDDVVVRGDRRMCGLAFDEGEDLAPLLVDAEKARCPVEADSLEVLEQCVHRGAPRSDLTSNGVADLDDGRHITAVQHLLRHERSIRSAASCSRRRSFSSSSIARIVSPMRVPG